jgi:hypothetical protein
MALCAGCSATPRAGSAGDEISSGAAGETLETGGEVGGMDRDEVRKVVRRVAPKVEGCIANGRKKLPQLEGEVRVFVRVDRGGRAIESYLPRSTLGDHGAEECILRAFAAPAWPRPVGGDTGEISQSFAFEAAVERPPEAWSPSELAAAMRAEADDGAYQELLKGLDGCRNEAGVERIDVTMHLDEDGLVQGVGLGSGDSRARKAVSCVVALVTTTSFPSPGESGAKVTLGVP